MKTIKPRIGTVSTSRLAPTERGTATERGYDARWRRERLEHLRAEPLCRMCKDDGIVTMATVVDHAVPHKGDQRLFWDRGNWASLCGPCHNGRKAAQERADGYR